MQQNGEIRGVKGGVEGPGGYREVWLLAYPIVITMLSRTAMMFVDSAMVGRLGATELAAVGLAGILTWTLFSFFQGFLGSVNTFVAQRYGAGDRRGITVAAWQGLYLALGSYLIILVISLFTVPVVCPDEAVSRGAASGRYLRANSVIRRHHRLYLFWDGEFSAGHRRYENTDAD